MTVRYGEKVAVDGVSFAVGAGEIVGLVGPNGAGKTSTIHSIAGLVAFTGTIRVSGQRPGSARAQERLRLAPQGNAVAHELSVRQNLSFVERILNQTGRTWREAAEMLGLELHHDTRAGKLSGGFARRLHVAAALIGDPDVLILDEPSVGMDLDSRRRLIQVVSEIAGTGVAILFATHQVEEIEEIADRIVLLQHGKVRFDAPPVAYRHRRADLFVRLVGHDIGPLTLPNSACEVATSVSEVTFLLSNAAAISELGALLAQLDQTVGIEVRPPTLEESIWSLLNSE